MIVVWVCWVCGGFWWFVWITSVRDGILTPYFYQTAVITVQNTLKNLTEVIKLWYQQPNILGRIQSEINVFQLHQNDVASYSEISISPSSKRKTNSNSISARISDYDFASVLTYIICRLARSYDTFPWMHPH